MLSPALLSPLNSSTTTVSSSSSFLLSSESTDLNKNSPFSLFHLSFSSPFVITIFRTLLFLLLVSLATSLPRSNSTTHFSAVGNGSQHIKKSFWNSNSTEQAQGDEPPRNMGDINKTPNTWGQQPQERTYYMHAVNGQFLQFKDGIISGTHVSKPKYGIVKFFSHEGYVIIRSYHDNRTLCMNNASNLYMAEKEDSEWSECYITESHPEGSFYKSYMFVKYSTQQNKRYLGINCNPIPGIQTDIRHKSSRFSTLEVVDPEAIRKEIEKLGTKGQAEQKCENRKQAEKAKRIKLRRRWCWNLDRMTRKRQEYLNKCFRKHKKKCSADSRKKNKKCVCSIMMQMLNKSGAKRAKRKCLIEKLTRWVQKQKQKPNKEAIKEAAKLLLPSYSKIARRMRAQLKKKSSRRSTASVAAQNSSISNQTSQSSISHRCHKGSSKRRGRKKRQKAIKLNPCLSKYKQELFLSNTTPNVKPANSSESQGSEIPVIDIHQSLLSATFREKLQSLSDSSGQSSRRHKRKHHKKGKRRKKKSAQDIRQYKPEKITLLQTSDKNF